MTGYTPPYRDKQPGESETAYVQDIVEHARLHQEAVEAVRRSLGRIYDPILQRWVPCDG